MTLEKNYIFPIYVNQDVLVKIKLLCKNIQNEIFGYLIGNILKWNEKIYIRIKELLFLIGAIHSDKYSTSQIEGTAGKYEKKFQRLKRKREDDSLRVVGWWHSHPGFGCFLSPTDVKTQEFFFPESYQVALVVDPVNDNFQFFTLDKSSEKGYKEVSYAILNININ
ncbi:MAG: Mov34/MPN/PAD-1 family protein [Candidatus Hodarchaeota archaeon]